jgi:hypothetical protein
MLPGFFGNSSRLNKRTDLPVPETYSIVSVTSDII